MKKEIKYSKMTAKETLNELLRRINNLFPQDGYKWSSDNTILMVQRAQKQGEDCIRMIIEKLFDDIKNEKKKNKSKSFVRKSKSKYKKSKSKVILSTESIDKW